MGEFVQQIIATLITFPGNLVYHLILAFSIAGTLQAAMNLWRSSGFPQGRRMVIGLGLLLTTRLILFIGAIFASGYSSDTPSMLPILERGVAALSLILIIWLWAFPEPTRTADVTTGLLAILTIIAGALSVSLWMGDHAEQFFNQTWLDMGWEIYSLVILILGIILILMRRPNAWGVALTMLGFLTFGHLSHLIKPLSTSDIPGSVRLAQMAAYPLLLALPHRFQIPLVVESAAPKPEPLIKERAKYSVSPELFRIITSIDNQKTFADVCQVVTEMIANVLLADICLALLPPNKDGHITVQAGYDLIRQKKIMGTVFERNNIPMILSAMERGAPLRLPASSTSQDLISLANNLQIRRAGHLLASFVEDSDQNLLMGILLLSPYSNRSWTNNDQAFLTDITEDLVQILQRSQQWRSLQDEVTKNRHNLQSIQSLLEETQNENAGLRAALSDLSQQSLREYDADNEFSPEVEFDTMAKIARLQAENLRLEELVEQLLSGNLSSDDESGAEQLERELHLALEEIALLKTRLTTVDQDLLKFNFETAESDQRPDQQKDVIISIAQELRQPMSSIIGYTDLLLGESIGILGELQRKFLERIRASTERMHVMLDDLFQTVSIEEDRLQLNPEVINLGNIIDEAILATSSQLRDRHIILRVDLPEELPQLQADPDALGQVFFHLLKNAGDASPIEGEILLRASTYKTDENKEYVLVQFADQGGGIPTQDLPLVFSRSLRADLPLIEGLGDNGVGLSIAKTLVEAHNGRIWVDTESGKGSTFSILIPSLNGNSGEPSL